MQNKNLKKLRIYVTEQMIAYRENNWQKYQELEEMIKKLEKYL